MELFKSDFETTQCKNFLVLRSRRINNNLFQTPKNFKKNIQLKYDSLNINLLLNQVVFKKNLIIFRFNPVKNILPKNIKNASIIITNEESTKNIIVKNELNIENKKLPTIEPDVNSSKKKLPTIEPDVNSSKKKLPTIEPDVNLSKKKLPETMEPDVNSSNKKIDLDLSNEIRREIRKNIPTYQMISNPYIYTNVESGYSAKSFPYVYIQRYDYGPQPGRYQTTPQVAL